MTASKKEAARIMAKLAPYTHETFHGALKEAVKDLFTSSLKERASRLVLVDDDGRDMGGWCQESVKQLSDALGIELRD